MTGAGDTGNGSVRRRRVDPERRTQLLADLEELVLAEGFMALSMDDLAHRPVWRIGILPVSFSRAGPFMEARTSSGSSESRTSPAPPPCTGR